MFVTMWAVVVCVGAEPALTLQDFEGAIPPAGMVQNHTAVEAAEQSQGQALRVRFEKTDWPNVFFAPADGSTWDWSAYAGLAVEITNPEREDVKVSIRIDNAGADGLNHCNTASATVPPGETVTMRAYFNTGDPGPFWGMRGLPVRGPLSSGPAIDTSRITAYQVYLPLPERPTTLVLDNLRLFGQGGPMEELVPLPFIDRFGQFKHADWPGKLHAEEEWTERRAEEDRQLAEVPELADRDRFGGWTGGPQLEATGWFRTAKVDGRWWLVTPEGHLFFSTGMDCVGTWEQTFVAGRPGWFEWLPEPDGPFKGCYGYAESVHSMAEPVGGKGQTFNWYRCNLQRKYGEGWAEAWRDTTVKRLKAWGFNTVGNWSQDDVVQTNRLPFTATCGIGGGVPNVEGGAGYWGKMKDVYAEPFGAAVDEAIASVARRYGENPLCIGYFVDNELSWGTPSGYDIAVWTLASPATQPCRVEFVTRLETQYGSLEELNRAWGTSFAGWDALRAPEKVNEACARDLDAFVYSFARRYFEAVQEAIRKHAPHQLYLGCRFSTASRGVVKACAEIADVVSFNLYQRTIDAERWTGENDLGKPILIGEFHFGALDRGMFHTGLVPTEDQNQRAESYARYVRSVAECPAFVGCHWFQYVDEPTTGRFFDGENYNIGFVSVTDTPYAELVEATKRIHGTLYGLRAR